MTQTMTVANGPSSDVAVDKLQEALKRRDDELDSLREELSKLRHELGLATAERDSLKGVSKPADEPNKVSADGGPEFKPISDFTLEPGENTTTPVEDPRIGKPKRILVIGGGPGGIITLHELLNPVNRPVGQKDEVEVQLYERRAEVGGVWYFEPENDIAKGWHHGAQGWHAASEEDLSVVESNPSPDPDLYQNAGDMEMIDPSWWKRKELDRALVDSAPLHKESTLVNGHPETNGSSERQGSVTSVDFCYFDYPQKAPRWPSAAYEGLVGNVLPPLLEFSAKPINKPRGGLFPSMVETHNYLLEIAEPLRKYIKTSQEVKRVEPKFEPGSPRVTWTVTRIDWSAEGGADEIVEDWDAIIACVGAYDHPFYPDTPGLAALLKQGSPLVMHAKTYPGPRPFVNQHNKFLVVGNANSANDIAAHLAPLNSSGPLYRSIRHESMFAHLPDPRIKDVSPIANVKESSDRRTLRVELTDGTVIDGITKLIYASGYEYRFRWMSVPPPYADITKPDSFELESASKFGAVPNLHNTTIHSAAPTLAFIGLNAGSAPNPYAEVQARIVSRVLYGLLSLPESRDELLKDYLERKKEVGAEDGDPTNWRAIHMVRRGPERNIMARLIKMLEDSEKGASKGLFRWDEWREGIMATLRKTKEAELRRVRNAKVAAGGVDGGVGGVLSYGPVVGQKFTPVKGDRQSDRGKSLML